ncbi:Pachytene checkpoint protein 2 [Dinochytrium kinnereticum]|nr:Pachytene checkpoint protein 2 [Dinochytrium kinnereticum]
MDADDGDNTISSTIVSLPSRSLEGLWESLIFEGDILQKLLNYVSTSMLFADREIDANIISFNKVILLHGPPGTGNSAFGGIKLSIKLSIRMAEKYTYVKLVEINSHSLFSKFFSESGKLVMKMFQSIKELCEDRETFVTVLIGIVKWAIPQTEYMLDEVESLTAARKAAVSGMEPSDAFRVVNALLTQIDALKRRKNVLILTTSNITEAIDAAHISNSADLKQYIEELMRRGLVSPSCSLIDWRAIDIFSRDTDPSSISHMLYDLAGLCAGFSGRTIRKLPFLAHAVHLKTSQSVSPVKFIDALRQAIEGELENPTEDVEGIDRGTEGQAGTIMKQSTDQCDGSGRTLMEHRCWIRHAFRNVDYPFTELSILITAFFFSPHIQPTRLHKTRKLRGHVSCGHGRIFNHLKHTSGRGLAGGQHHHRINMDKYHPGYFGKVGMRYFHKTKNQYFNKVVNLDKIWSQVPTADRLAAAAKPKGPVPVIDLTASGTTKLLGKGKLPQIPFIVKTRLISRKAELKIIEAGGKVELVA